MTTYLWCAKLEYVIERKEIFMDSKALSDEIIHLFTRMNKIKFFRNIAPNLTPSETDVLMLLFCHLEETGEELTVKDISSFFEIKTSTTIQFVNSLEKYNYIKRKSDPKDKRITLVSLTNYGKKVAEIVDKNKQEVMRQIILSEDVQEINNSFALLNRILNTIDAIPIQTISIREDMNQ